MKKQDLGIVNTEECNILSIKLTGDRLKDYTALCEFAGQKLIKVSMQTESVMRPTSDNSGVNETEEAIVLTFTNPKK